jgi:hypothetical protein
MADYKISELNADASPAGENLIAQVDDPGGSAETKKSTLSQVVGGLKATGAEINTGTEDAKIVTPKAIADSGIGKAKATGAEINTGTDDAKFVTPKAIADSGISTAKATGAEINTGTDDAKFATPKAIADSVVETRYRCKVKMTSDQTLGNASYTTLTWGGETWDVGTMHDNSTNPDRITIPRTGIYLVHLQVSWRASATGSRLLGVSKNGTSGFEGQPYSQIVAADSTTHRQLASAILALNATDYLLARAYQNSGGNLDIIADDSTWFSVVYIGK